MLTSAISQSMRQKVKSEPLKVKRKAGYTMGKTHATVTLLLLRKPYFPFKSQNATQHLPLESAFTDQRGQGGQGGRQGEAPAGPEGGQSRAEARGASWPACPPHASFSGSLPLPRAALGFAAGLHLSLCALRSQEGP